MNRRGKRIIVWSVAALALADLSDPPDTRHFPLIDRESSGGRIAGMKRALILAGAIALAVLAFGLSCRLTLDRRVRHLPCSTSRTSIITTLVCHGPRRMSRHISSLMTSSLLPSGFCAGSTNRRPTIFAGPLLCTVMLTRQMPVSV